MLLDRTLQNCKAGSCNLKSIYTSSKFQHAHAWREFRQGTETQNDEAGCNRKIRTD